MHDYFEHEIKRLEREVTALKTSGQKSASAPELFTRTTEASIPLVLEDSPYDPSASGSRVFVVRTDDDAIMGAYLDWYVDDVSQLWKINGFGAVRSASIDQGVYNGLVVIVVRAFGGDDDVAVLRNGGRITVPLTLTIRCTDDFTVEEI